MGKLRTNSITKANQTGVSLVETMVALFILAVGTLGVLAMQVNALRVNQNAYLFSQAGFFAENIAEAMRSEALANPGVIPNPFATNFPSGTTCTSEANSDEPDGTIGSDCGEGACADIVSHNLWKWCGNLGFYLPLGEGAIQEVTSPTNNSPGIYKITISFQQESLGDDDNNRSTYELRVEI